jgi:hypothetical protein
VSMRTRRARGHEFGILKSEFWIPALPRVLSGGWLGAFRIPNSELRIHPMAAPTRGHRDAGRRFPSVLR